MDGLAREKLAIATERAKAKAGKKVEKLKRNQAKKMKFQRRLGFFMGVGSTCLVIGGVMAAAFPVIDYVRGRLLLRQKSYTQAAEMLEKCGDYLNSKAFKYEALYRLGEECLAEERFQDAYKAFSECGDYKDSAERAAAIMNT